MITIPGRLRQRGAATLVVVMVLFFVVSLVAAYASRNLLFEQKTAANQYRSTAVLEVADAGLQWAAALLNGGRIDANCQPSANLALSSFRQRYLDIADDGTITPRTLPAPSTVALNPSCVFDGNGWQCSCPTDASPVLAAPGGSAMYPAYRLRFVALPGRPGLVRIEVNACSRADDACLNFPATGAPNESRVTVSAILALKGGVATVPGAALTARENVTLTAINNATLVNTRTDSGVTVNAGQAVNASGATLVTAPGSPGLRSIVPNDLALKAPALAVNPLATPPLTASNSMFARTFGQWPADYRSQPGAVVINCGITCSASQVRDAIAQGPGRVIWLDGTLNIDTGGDIGSDLQPVSIVATGGVEFSAAATVYGLIYSRAATWTLAGNGGATVRGAILSEGDIDGSSNVTVHYDLTVLNRVRQKSGSFVVVPGSWKDF